MLLHLFSALFLGITGTCLTIFLGYFERSYLDIGLSVALAPFLAWPWALLSLSITLISIGVSFAISVRSNLGKDKKLQYQVMYCMFVPGIAVVLSYPGLNKLGLYYDDSIHGVTTWIMIIQSIVVWIMSKGLKPRKRS